MYEDVKQLVLKQGLTSSAEKNEYITVKDATKLSREFMLVSCQVIFELVSSGAS